MIAINLKQLLTRFSLLWFECARAFYVRHRFKMVGTTSDDGNLG